jgi:endonuclease/exonuclease/phosphatase family metal-dependent hydrolase
VRLVTWNCQGGFRNKSEAIEALRPDIAIIQECEAPDRLRTAGRQWAERSIIWHGENPTKGLAIIAFNGAQLTLDASHDPTLKHLIPVSVTGEPSFRVLAVWTKVDEARQAAYVGQAVLGVRKYVPFLSGSEVVVAGDFNSNQIWDAPNRRYRHAELVEGLAAHGLVSIYHDYYRELHGAESRNTFYMYRQLGRPFHIDYCFVPRAWARRVRSVEVGAFDHWSQLSDHCPLIVDVGDRGHRRHASFFPWRRIRI